MKFEIFKFKLIETFISKAVSENIEEQKWNRNRFDLD